MINYLKKQLNLQTLEFSKDLSKGHLTSKDGFVKAKEYKLSPKETAKKLVSGFVTLPDMVKEVEVAGGGFINIYLTNRFLLEKLKTVGAEQNQTPQVGPKKKVMIEYTDPNPFKVFHIGHLLPNIIGQSLSNIFEYLGYNVKRVNYQGDVGMHVAKAIYGIQKLGGLKQVENKSLEERIEFLGKAYVLGADLFEKNNDAKKDVKELNKKVYLKSSSILYEYDLGKKWSLEKFEEIYKRLGTKFDYYYFESDTAKVGLEVVKEGMKQGVLEKSEGAIVFKGEKEGLHTRVFVNSEGLPTYEAKELGLAKTKYKDFPYDLSIVVTGNEINEYFKVLLSVLSKLYPKLGKRTKHVGHGMLTLSNGKMSSRTGNVIYGEDLLNIAVDQVSKILSTRKDLSDSEKLKIKKLVGIGAVKYMILKPKVGTNIVFDIEESVKYEGNSGPYLQYTCVRANSILSKISTSTDTVNMQSVEIELILKLAQFNDIILKCADQFSPHYLSNYLFELASLFNSFYVKVKVDEGTTTKKYRLQIVKNVSETLTIGLGLLGIKVPSKM